MKSLLKNNGLAAVFCALFLATLLGGQLPLGNAVNNETRGEHGLPPLGMGEYLLSGHFLEATMENWESEFLQMFAFVLATALLFQKGSAESRDPDSPRTETRHITKRSPSPVRKGGWRRTLYGHSLSLTLFACFATSFWLHARGGMQEQNEDARLHGKTETVTTWSYMGTDRFWFESFQNWQSEFLSVAAMVVFSIFLREKGSSQSKPVESARADTGT